MKAFETTSAQVIGTFPSTAAKQSSGAGATDGTPLHSDYFNNFWGWVQDLLNRAGLTPSGVLEAKTNETGVLPLGTTATQIRTALQMSYGSPGELVLWCRNQLPAIVGARILLLQGQTFLISNYPDLVAATYCGDGVNNTTGVPFYRSSDSGGATRSTTGAYFTLPDFRGCTIRGVSGDNSRDPLATTRGGGYAPGSIELDALQGHYHSPAALGGGPAFLFQVSSGGNMGIAGGGTTQANSGATGSPITDSGATEGDGSTGTTPRTSKETRMINGGVYIGIRY